MRLLSLSKESRLASGVCANTWCGLTLKRTNCDICANWLQLFRAGLNSTTFRISFHLRIFNWGCQGLNTGSAKCKLCASPMSYSAYSERGDFRRLWQPGQLCAESSVNRCLSKTSEVPCDREVFATMMNRSHEFAHLLWLNTINASCLFKLYPRFPSKQWEPNQFDGHFCTLSWLSL